MLELKGSPISAIHYVEEDKLLYVVFPSGNVYKFFEVTDDAYRCLIESQNPLMYLRTVTAKQFKYVQISAREMSSRLWTQK